MNRPTFLEGVVVALVASLLGGLLARAGQTTSYQLGVHTSAPRHADQPFSTDSSARTRRSCACSRRAATASSSDSPASA
jgi:hypothetical protein